MSVSIYVIYFSDGWSTMVNGRRGARHRYQVDAIEAALRLAAEVRRHGYEALICVQDRFGEIRPLAEPQASPEPALPIPSVTPTGSGRERGDLFAAGLASS